LQGFLPQVVEHCGGDTTKAVEYMRQLVRDGDMEERHGMETLLGTETMPRGDLQRFSSPPGQPPRGFSTSEIQAWNGEEKDDVDDSSGDNENSDANAGKRKASEDSEEDDTNVAKRRRFSDSPPDSPGCVANRRRFSQHPSFSPPDSPEYSEYSPECECPYSPHSSPDPPSPPI
jgi:hypothetical protein